jgi:uncharacterized protein involved in outer membrane biogenesis
MLSKPQKIGLAILCIVGGFAVAVVFIAPRIVEINRYRPEVISYIEQQTGRRAEIGRLKLSILPAIKIDVEKFALANPPGFPDGNWIAVDRIDARLDGGALFRRQVVIRALNLAKPILELYSRRPGDWNFQDTPPAFRVRVPADDPPLFAFREISNLMLSGGQINIQRLLPDGSAGARIFKCQGLVAHIDDIEIPEWTSWPATAPPKATPGAAGKSPAPADSTPSGMSSGSSGKLTATAMWFGNFLATHVQAAVRGAPARLSFNNVRFDFYGGRASGNGSLDLLDGRYQTQVKLSGVNVETFLAEIPALRGQMTGAMTGQLSFSGETAATPNPWAENQGEGELLIRKGRWPKLRLDQTLLQLAHLAQLGPVSGNPSAFSSLSAAWTLRDGIIEISSFHVIGKGITLGGSASLDLASQDRLQVDGVAGVAARQNPLSTLLARLLGVTLRNGRIELPFAVTGTLQRPVFQLKVHASFPPAAGLEH